MAQGKLSITPPLGETAVHDLTSPELILGRSTAADLTLADPLVSQRHARLFTNEAGTWLEDLGSTNGTFVNGLRLAPHAPVLLSDGAQVEMGDTKAQFSAGPLAGVGDTFITKSRVHDETLVTQSGAAGQFLRRHWLKFAVGGLFLGFLVLLAGAYFLWPRSPTEDSALATPTTITTLISPDETPITAVAVIEPCLEPTMPIDPGAALADAPLAPGRPIQSIAFLDLPFPYDGSNENFGGSLATFRQAVQRSSAGGRINSFFDHFYPLYPAPDNPAITFGREPAAPPIGGNILLFDGQLSNYDYYSGHPAYDFSTYIPRQPTTPVFAAADGIIYDVGEHSSGALFVRLEHVVPDVGNYLTIYWHLHPDAFFAAMAERRGEPITAGTRLGTMGNTGWSTGHHLHFEVRFDRNGDRLYTADETVDPFGFIPSPAYPGDPWAQSTSFTDARGQLYNHAVSPSRYLWVHPLGLAAQIPDTGGGEVHQNAAGGTGTGTLCAPAGTFPPGGTVYWSWAPDPPASADLAGTGNGCVLAALDANGSPVTAFNPPVRVALPFDPGDYPFIAPDSVAIYWQDAGSPDWYPLATQFDPEKGIAAAETNRPGHCALMGRSTQDIVNPETIIEISGEQGLDGVWYDEVMVSAESSDASGIAKLEYSLDAGTTWLPYTGPIQLQANGIPEPLPDELEEDFGSGPGRFLVLFSATDNAGNVEDPPAFIRVVIDPSKAPPEAAVQATPSVSPSPTTCVPMVTAVLDANVRWGPGLIYHPPVAALAVGESALILGKNRDASWWQIDLDSNFSGQFWVADSVVAVNCGREDVPVVATPVPPTFTPTPTNTPTPTPTSTPTLTPTLTPTATPSRFPDSSPPSISVTHAPSVVFESNPVTISALAKDNLGVARIEIWVRPSGGEILTLVQTCLKVSSCVYQGGPYFPGTVTYMAFAWDTADNKSSTNQMSFTVLSVPR